MRLMIFAALVSTHATKWANNLVDRGHEVMVVCYPIKMKPNVRFDERVKLHQLRYGGRLGYYLNVPEVKRLVKRYKPDIVNAHYASGFGTLCRLAKVHPFVISCYGSDVYTYPFLNKFNMWNIRRNLRYADAIACTGYAMADQTRKVLGDPNQEITVTPFGVDVNRFAPSSAKKENLRPVIGIIKYLEPIYDIPLLINGFSLYYQKAEIKPILRIYGDGGLKEELVALTNKLGISESVFFMGPIPNSEVPNALNEMDVFVNCSHKESFGVNMVEAEACGVPVVATATAGAQEVVDDGVTGFVLPDRNPETMAAAFDKLLSDKKMMAAMGKAGREKVLKLYDWEKNYAVMVNLYQSLIK